MVSWRRARGAFGIGALATALLSTFVVAQDGDGNTSGQSTFVAPDKSIAFGFTVPGIQGRETYFTLRVPADRSWGAIGLGSSQMEKSLILMIYMNEARDNITFSARHAHGHYEPQYLPEFQYEVLRAGIVDDHMIFSARCTAACRSWPGGWLDVSSNTQSAIYAVGPRGKFSSNDPAANLNMHAEHGAFNIDIGRTLGFADAPEVSDESKNEGTSMAAESKANMDKTSVFHAMAMIVSFVVLMPAGVLLLRAGNSVKWHSVNQVVAMVIALVGFALGVQTSFTYQRSRSFNSTHQILGFVVVGLLLGQFVLGVLHHQLFKKSQRTTKLAPVHRWLGRILLPASTVNAFIGFRFALNNSFAYLLLAVVLCLVCLNVFFLWRGASRGKPNANTSTESGYGPEPWRHADESAKSGPALYNDPPSPAGRSAQQDIGLSDVRPYQVDDRREEFDLGREQKPREF